MDDRLKAREEELIAIAKQTGADLEMIKSRLETGLANILHLPPSTMRAERTEQ